MSSYPMTRESMHKENLQRKAQRVEGLRALLQTHEASDEPDDDYILELRARLRMAEHQYNYMRP